MSVNFICDLPGEFATPVEDDYPELLRSALYHGVYASLRVRCMLPLSVIGRAIPARLVSYRTALASRHRFGASDSFVLFKVGAGSLDAQPGLAEAIRDFADWARGRIVYDTSDPQHRRDDASGALQRDLLARASLVTCASPELVADVAGVTQAPTAVIDDAIDAPEAPPHDRFSDPVRLAWFGWMTEPRAVALAAQLRRIADRVVEQRFACLVLSQPLAPADIAALDAAVAGPSARRILIGHKAWHLPEAWDALAAADIAVIPQDPDGDDRLKSHNRLSTAIRRGVFAVASPIPAYAPLRDYCWLGTDFAAGVAWALAHPAEMAERVRTGQKRVAELYGPQAIGERWVQVLREHGLAR